MSRQPSSSNPDPATNEYTDHIVCKPERWPLDDVGCPLPMLQALGRVVPVFEFVARAENFARMSQRMRLTRLRSNVVSVRIALRSCAAAGADALHPAALVRFRYTEALYIACRLASSCFTSTAAPKAPLVTAIVERVFHSRRSKCLLTYASFNDTCGARIKVAGVLSSQGLHSDACNTYQEALAFHKLLYGCHHPDTVALLLNLQSELLTLGRLEEAFDLQQEHIVCLRCVDGDQPYIASAMMGLASKYSELALFRKALVLQQEARIIFEHVLPFDHPDIANAIMSAASTLSSLGRLTGALDACEQARTLLTRIHGPHSSHPSVASALLSTAEILSSLGRFSEALDLNQKAVEMVLQVQGLHHPLHLSAMTKTARIYSAMGREECACSLYEQMHEVLEQVLPAGCLTIVSSSKLVAESYFVLGRYNEALSLFEQIRVFCHQQLPLDHPDITAAVRNVEKCRYALAVMRGDDDSGSAVADARAGCI